MVRVFILEPRCSVVGSGTMLQAGLIPDEVIAFLNWPNPSSRGTIALGSTQPNRNEYQEFSWRWKGNDA
jgi:hypothetical protein